MKRICSILCILALSLAGCGAPKAQTAAAETAEAVKIATEFPAETTVSAQAPLFSVEELPGFRQEARIQETVLYSDHDVVITATELNYTHYGLELSLQLENNSETELTFICQSLGYSRNAANGCMIQDGYVHSSVPAGKKASETLDIAYHALQILGIQELQVLEIGFEIQDPSYDSFYTGPLRLETSAYDPGQAIENTYQTAIVSPASQHQFQYHTDFFATGVPYEQSGIRALSCCLLSKGTGEELLALELENTSDRTVMAGASRICINGLDVYSSLYTRDALTPGNRGLLTIELSHLLGKSVRELLGVTEIGSVGFTLELEDEDGNAIGSSQKLTINLPDRTPALDSSGPSVYEEDGIRLVYKGIVESDKDYSDDLNLILLAQNSSGIDLAVRDNYDPLSVNGFVVDSFFYGNIIADGNWGMIRIELNDSSLEKNGLSLADITDAEFGIEIWTENSCIGEAAVTVPCK